MKNWDITAADRARAHSKQGEKLSQRLALSQAELARRSEILQRSQAGSAVAASVRSVSVVSCGFMRSLPFCA